MKPKEQWLRPFNISETNLEQWYKEIPSGTSLTYWALETHKISEQEYFTWARDHFAIPSLNEKASCVTLNFVLWKELRHISYWSCEMLPLAEWDGTIFIICIEVPSDIEWDFSVQYILASPQQLKYFWTQLNEMPLTDTKIKIGEDIPSTHDKPSNHLEHLHPVHSKEVTVTSIDPFKELLSTMDEMDEEDEKEVSSSQPEEDLSLLSLALPELSEHDKPSNHSEHLHPVHSKEMTATSIDPFKEFLSTMGKEDEVDEKEVSSSQPEEDLSLLSLALPELSEHDKLSNHSEHLHPVHSVDSDHLKKEKKEATVTSIDPFKELLSTIDEADEAGEKSENDLDDAEIDPKEMPIDSQFLQTIWEELSMVFQSSLLIRLHEGGQFHIWTYEPEKWNISKKATRISLNVNKPSAFRIAKNGHTFHGPMSTQNPIHKEFFRLCGLTNPSEHVTIIPLHSNSNTNPTNILGFLFAMGDTPDNHDKALKIAEECSTKISDHVTHHFDAA